MPLTGSRSTASTTLPPHRYRYGMLYPDKWSAPYVAIEFPQLQGRVTVDIELWNPEMPDFEGNDVVLRANHRIVRHEKNLRSGDVRHIHLELDAVSVDQRPFIFSIRSAAHFTPKLPDTRVLAIILRSFTIKSQ